MSNVVVVAFDNQHEAAELRQTLRNLQEQELIDIEDSAVILRDADGKVMVDDETSHGVKVGAGAGALAGIFLFFMFPVVGAALGAAGGAFVARSMDLGIDKKFVKDVTDSLQPDSSALLVVVNSSNHAAVRGALEPYKGTVLQTSLDPDAEATLRDALSHRV
jgi:uncharacterized membrane protein